MRWIIGDIHGMHRPLRALLDEIGRRDPWAQLLFVGDYVNRGPDSRGVIETLLSLSNAHFVRGNHDDILDHVLHGSAFAPHTSSPNSMAAFVWFMEHGLDHTFGSYGVDWEDLEQARTKPTPDRIQKIASAVPESHRRFLRKLSPVIEHDDIVVAHGFWPIDETDDIAARMNNTDARHALLWGRFEESHVKQAKRWKRTIYFGHTPVQTFGPAVRPADNVPIVAPNMVLIDTGAAYGPNGRLSSVCVETGELIQADRTGALVS